MKKENTFIVRTPSDLGDKARQYRKGQNVSIEDTAPMVNLGQRFISELERGKETAEIGKVLQLLNGIGLSVMIIPTHVASKIDHQLTMEAKGKASK